MTRPITRLKAADPEHRMGIYKRLESVPERYRFRVYSSEYEDRDVWGEYITAEDERRGLSEWYLDRAETAERNWKVHIAERGRHHALATPKDVELWCRDLLEARKLRTVYERYWVQIEQFYTWLQFHAEHPHVYHPVLMAAAEYKVAGTVWDRKIENGDQRARELARGER